MISDTHGLVRPEVVQAFGGVERILHMGDVGGTDVLDELGAVAPVAVVRGNTDRGAWADALPQNLTLELFGELVHLVHDLETLDLDPRAAGVSLVLFGHSHKPAEERRDGVLYVNPGAAGPRRFTLPVSVAFLEPGMKVTFQTL